MSWFIPDTTTTIDYVSPFDPAVDRARLKPEHYSGRGKMPIQKGKKPVVFRFGAPDPYELGKVKAEFLVEEQQARQDAIAKAAARMGKTVEALTFDERVMVTMGVAAPYDETYEIIRLCLRDMVGADLPKDETGRYTVETIRKIHRLLVDDLGQRCRSLCELEYDLTKNF